MIIKYFPFIQAMIEQEEIITIDKNNLNFKRVFGPNVVNQNFELTDYMIDLVNKVKVEEKELVELLDVIVVDDIYFNIINQTESYKKMCESLSTLNFMYKPRALNIDCLFYLGDFKQHFIHHFYEDALSFIKENNITLNNNECIIDNEIIKIELDNYKVLSFNTDNTLHQVIISTLVYNRYGL